MLTAIFSCCAIYGAVEALDDRRPFLGALFWLVGMVGLTWVGFL